MMKEILLKKMAEMPFSFFGNIYYFLFSGGTPDPFSRGSASRTGIRFFARDFCGTRNERTFSLEFR